MSGILFHMLSMMSQKTESDHLVELGILSKPISEFTNDDIGTIVLIPYTDFSGKILLNNGCIEFEVVGVNHHKDINDESKPTITLMSKSVIRRIAFDAKEPNNPDSGRAEWGNNRWSVSNIRQWLNSEGAANEWFTPQHEYDEAPTTDKVDGERPAYAEDPGFLDGFSDEVKQHFATIRNKTILSSYDKELLSKDFEETEDKVFLPSLTEMNGSNTDYNNPEGSHLSIRFPDYNSIIKSGDNEPVELGRNTECYWLRTICYSDYPTGNADPAVVIIIDGWGAYYEGFVFENLSGIAPLIVLC